VGDRQNYRIPKEGITCTPPSGVPQRRSSISEVTPLDIAVQSEDMTDAMLFSKVLKK